jgi:uncharacterized membrane protein YheB (UPF0754 family)
LIIPFVTALIGWITNYVAVKMLFKPRMPINIGGYKLQGLIPTRQKDMAKECAEILEREILQQNMLSDAIKKIDLNPLLKDSVSKLVQEKIPTMVQMFAPDMADKLKTATPLIESMVMSELLKEGEIVKDRLSKSIGETFDIKEIVEDKIANFDLDKLESIVTGVANREFKNIERMGAILGFAIGVGQVLMLKAGLL